MTTNDTNWIEIVNTLMLYIVFITLGEANSQSLAEVYFSLKEILNESNNALLNGTTIENNNNASLLEPITYQSVWDFVKMNKWYILIGGITVVGITAILYKYLSTENLSVDNTESFSEKESYDENTSVSSTNSYTAEAVSQNSQLEEEEISCFVMSLPRDESDLSDDNCIKFVVPSFVELHEFTTANVFVNTFKLDNGMKMFLKYVSLEMYTNFSPDEAMSWLDAWETYHYNYNSINR